MHAVGAVLMVVEEKVVGKRVGDCVAYTTTVDDQKF